MSKRFLTALDLTGTISTISAPERSLKWNDGEGTLEIGLKGGNVKLPVGQEEISLCYNGTGSTLNKGTVVYISGAQGQRPSITKASASSESTSSKTFGVVSENISNGSEGFVTTFGVVPNIDTSSFTEGAALWLSTTAGEITQTPPTAPNHAVFVGYCLKSNISSGRIFVKVQNGYELQELHNVSITNPTTGQILQYNSVTGVWENVNSSSTPDVFYQTTAPSSPNVGNIWIDSDESVLAYSPVTLNDLLPNQTGNSGKYLTTDGTNANWATIDLSSYATKASPTFTGTPLAPTALVGTNTTQIATTEFVRLEIANLIASAPAALDTLDELAAALGDNANFASTVTNSIASKEPTIAAGTISQYWRGDKSWQTLDKTSVGLANVENTALSTWAGSSNITTVGTIGSGVWQGSSISTTYTDAKVTSVNGSTGAISGLATLASPTFTGTVVIPISTNQQTASYTLVLSDASKLIEMNVASANTVTVPPNSSVAFPVGTKIDIIQTGAGETSFVAGSGVTLNSDSGKLKINTQWVSASLVKRATDTWVLIGALKA